MIDFILQFHPVTQAFLATLFTWALTAAGAALVFMTRSVNQRLMDCMLGFAAGVMIAASFWSLLAPGIEMAEQMRFNPWLTAAIGFMAAVFSCVSPTCFCRICISEWTSRTAKG
jgi:ZIP family zinc transporter